MSDVVFVALITGTVTVLVSAGSVIAQILGPTWQARADREAAREAAAATARNDALIDLTNTMVRYATHGSNASDRATLYQSGYRYIAHLSDDEIGTGRYLREQLDKLVKRDSDRLEIAKETSDALLGLRNHELVGWITRRPGPKDSEVLADHE